MYVQGNRIDSWPHPLQYCCPKQSGQNPVRNAPMVRKILKTMAIVGSRGCTSNCNSPPAVVEMSLDVVTQILSALSSRCGMANNGTNQHFEGVKRSSLLLSESRAC